MSFVSKGYGGLSSDRHIFEDCGVILKFEKNTACMVDRGFSTCLHLLRGKASLPKRKFRRDKLYIAKARIHVERVIERVKRFRIFYSVIPLTMKDLLDDIVVVCSVQTNLMPPLIQNDTVKNKNTVFGAATKRR